MRNFLYAMLLITRLQDFLRNHNRSGGTHLSLITEGLETAKFRSFFTNWPQKVEPRLYEEGREKVAGLFDFPTFFS